MLSMCQRTLSNGICAKCQSVCYQLLLAVGLCTVFVFPAEVLFYMTAMWAIAGSTLCLRKSQLKHATDVMAKRWNCSSQVY